MRLLIGLLPALLLATSAPTVAAAPGATPPGAPPPPPGGGTANPPAEPAVSARPPTSGPARSGATPTAPPRPRVAVSEFVLEGEESSEAMAMQLQDGLILGLVRSGIDVLDSVDVTKRLARTPELERCETSPCLKRVGEVLKVRFTLRVRVTLSGNSYKMTARVFSTEGAAPAALPVAAHSRACDVCTVAEAREQMIRLADAVRDPIEARPGPPPPPPPPRPDRPSRVAPLLSLAASLAAVVGGAVLVSSAPEADKRQTAVGAALVGAGLATSAMSLYVAFGGPMDQPAGRSASVQVAVRF